MHRALRIGFFIASAAAIALADTVRADAKQEIAAFRGERARYALELTEPIAACVARRDTSHPAFHGCIDWHSSVHGVWALSAYTRVTGDQRFRAFIRSQLEPKKLKAERKYLAAHPKFETPYGRAWFLRLAIDYRRAFGDDRLDALADDVAQSLMAHYSRVEPDPRSVAYKSATWALINLYDYGAARQDEKILSFVRGKVRAHYLEPGPCPLSMEVETREFMAVCTNWAWLVGKVLPRAELKAWLAGFLPAGLIIEPIEDEASVHQAGLNFSRAWGLWNLYRMTDEPRFLTAYLQHFKSTFDRPDIWNGDYDTLSHWVAQFGMLALVVSYDDAHN